MVMTANHIFCAAKFFAKSKKSVVLRSASNVLMIDTEGSFDIIFSVDLNIDTIAIMYFKAVFPFC